MLKTIEIENIRRPAMAYIETNRKKQRKLTRLEKALMTALGLMLVIICIATASNPAEDQTKEILRAEALENAKERALFEQTERLIKIESQKFRDKCEMNKVLKLPLSKACLEVL